MRSKNGVILRLTKLTETSLIVTWCVDGVGIVKTVAKGARRSKSVYAGKLDLFYNAELSWVDSSRSELGTLKEVLVLDYAEELRRSYRNTLVAGYFTQLVEYVMESGEVVEDIYGLLVRALGYLKKQDAELRGVVYFEQEIAKLLGVWDGARAPHLSLESAVGGLPQGRDRCVTLLS